jgi:predicted acetyltransferase
MSLYLFEASLNQSRSICADGRFHYANLEAYWEDPGCYPFLIRVDGGLAGFVLVAELRKIEAGADGHILTEFFVLPGQRGRGVGEAAARSVFSRFPGSWWVGEVVWNTAAQAFWRTVIRRYTGGDFQEDSWAWDDETGVAQTFVTPSV